jgi:8-oxo-dGTP pyrophosphatase MutT (NUDIX family)
MELNESLIDCAVREVREETGLDVVITDVIGTYTDPDIRIEYSDGEVRREFTIVYYGYASNSEVVIDNESSAYAWILVSEVEGYPMVKSQQKRIKDVLEFCETGKKRME